MSFLRQLFGLKTQQNLHFANLDMALRHVVAISDEKMAPQSALFLLASSAAPAYLHSLAEAVASYLSEYEVYSVDPLEDRNQVRCSVVIDNADAVRAKLQELLTRNMAKIEGLSPQQIALFGKVTDILIGKGWQNDPNVLVATLTLNPDTQDEQMAGLIALFKGISFTRMGSPLKTMIDSESGKKIRFFCAADQEKALHAMMSTIHRVQFGPIWM